MSRFQLGAIFISSFQVHIIKFRLSGTYYHQSDSFNNAFKSLRQTTHICVRNLTTIGSVNALSPCRRQTITWTNAGVLLIGTLRTNFGEILIEIPTFSFKKMRLKVACAKWRPFCLGLNVWKMYIFGSDSIHIKLSERVMAQKFETTVLRVVRSRWYWRPFGNLKIKTSA